MSVITATDTEFKDQLSKHDKVVVKYYADWCGSCRLFAPKYRRMSDEDQYEDVVFLDVNAEQSPEARKAAGVDNLPFFAVFKDGKLVDGSASNKEEYLRNLIAKLN